MPDVILVADDDPDILKFVELNLSLEGFTVLTAANGEEALEVARANRPSLVILDVMMPRMDGYEVCQHLRRDRALGDVSIIMLTAKAMSADKVVGLTAGADDYISKPFDPMELVARVKNTMRRSQQMRAVSPLTGLPGNISIEAELARRLDSGEPVALLWLDLDNFKAFNDLYGFARGDDVIRYLADVLRECTADHPETFIGHIGGDDFVVIVGADDAEPLAKAITTRFDREIADRYDPADAARGSITVADRKGVEAEYPLVGVSIGAATSEGRQIGDHRELVELATEMKSVAKKTPGSGYAIDRRRPEGGSHQE